MHARTIIKIGLFLLLVGIGFATCTVLSSMTEPPKRQDKGEQATIVAAIEATPSARPVVVSAMGSVVPARQVTVFPEVAGRIIYQNPELIPGGRIKKGETLVRVDPRDYDLAIRAQQAQVSQAELNLAKEQSLKAVAEKEWALIKDEVQPTEQGRKLALREIQLENAKVAVGSAASALEKAQLARQRAAVRAPFNAVVIDKYVDDGQVVGPTSKIAVLADADTYWVRAAVPVDRLPWIQLPGVNSDLGSEVTVIQQAGPEVQIERTGRVIRLLPDLDPKGKMARVLIQVDAPWAEGATAQMAHAVGEEPPAKGSLSPMSENTPAAVATPDNQLQAALPLFLGSWVTVMIKGPKLEKVIRLPRLALRDRKQVWVKGDDDKLQIRAVRVVWSKADTVYVAGDLKPGDAVITSRISTPVEGMLVKTNGDEPGPVEAKAPPGAPTADEKKPAGSGES